MLRTILAAVLLVSLVSASGLGQGYKKKQFLKYAMGNMFAKCIGQQAVDKFMLENIKAAAKCHKRDFHPELEPVYIKPYPVEGGNYYNNVLQQQRFVGNNVPFHTHQQQQTYNQQPFQQYQQQPQYQQFQQPQYQQFQQQPQYQQQYRQPQTGYQQPQQFYAPGFGFQPVTNQVNGQVLNRQVRQAGKRNKVHGNRHNQVVATTNTVAGEAELYYFNKLKHHMTAKVGNFSCIMHEMGYFTEDNQVDLAKYKKAYRDLTTIPAAMKEEFIENIDLCHEVSECLPEKCFQKYPFGSEYGRSFMFVQCEKKKAMEVCLKKQMVDDYNKYKDLLKDEEIADNLETDEDFFSMF